MLRLVFELQPLFDAAGMKEFTDDLCSVNMPSTKVCMEISCTLGSGEIHGKQVEVSFNFVYTLALASYDW